MNECNDPNCPVHGHLKTRGRAFKGKVVSAKMQKSITVEIKRNLLIRKYNRYEKRYSKIKAHNPACMNAQEGQTVIIKECRPLSKTKAFVVTEVIKGELNESA